jgi:ribokinase
MSEIRPADVCPVIVVGSVNVDLVFRVERFPHPGETVLGGIFSQSSGGKGGNQASAAARLGAPTWIVGAVGKDSYGSAARADLVSAGVNVTRLIEVPAHTGVACVTIDRRAENAIVVANGANACLSRQQVVAGLDSVDADRAVLLTSCEIPPEATLAAVLHAKRRGWQVVVNPAPARPLSPELLGCVDVLTPNEGEMTSLASHPDILLCQGVGAVVVTAGGAGVDAYTSGDTWHQPAFPTEVVDSTGAGDAYTAALAVALARGWDLRQGVRYAAAVGALATRGIGARSSLPGHAETLQLLSESGR